MEEGAGNLSSTSFPLLNLLGPLSVFWRKKEEISIQATMESLPSAPLLEKRHLDGHCVSEDDCNYQRIFNEQQVMNVKAMYVPSPSPS